MRLLRLLPALGGSYDVVVVGGGPAGCAAAIQASRLGLRVLLVTERIGGLLSEAWIVDNYLMLPGASGAELVKRLQDHLARAGVPIVLSRIEKLERDGGGYTVVDSRGRKAYTKAVVVAIGLRRRRLGVPGEDRLRGRGVSYCAVCDAPLYRGADAVAVVGGGDSAAQAALLLANYAKKVYLVHRRSSLRASRAYTEKLIENPKIHLLLDHTVVEIVGREKVEAVKVRDNRSGEEKLVKVKGVFVEVGFEPDREWARRNGLETDEDGYIKVDEWMRTNLPGVFAAGDCTTMWKGYRQIALAAAMGMVAAYSAYKYLATL